MEWTFDKSILVVRMHVLVDGNKWPQAKRGRERGRDGRLVSELTYHSVSQFGVVS